MTQESLNQFFSHFFLRATEDQQLVHKEHFERGQWFQVLGDCRLFLEVGMHIWVNQLFEVRIPHVKVLVRVNSDIALFDFLEDRAAHLTVEQLLVLLMEVQAHEIWSESDGELLNNQVF